MAVKTSLLVQLIKGTVDVPFLFWFDDFNTSLPDTEAAEDFAKQVVGGEFAGDFVEVLLGETQLFSEQLAGER